jgi:hypothetical protein
MSFESCSFNLAPTTSGALEEYFLGEPVLSISGVLLDFGNKFNI